ncbi:MAG: hypothetical protein QOD06_1364 [Candidatus Binatota bacterium]|jgi:hypothetical protein|nr:hypothetical protein [Candidatus Binatota bacterium]
MIDGERDDPPPSYWLTRFLILRLLGAVYLVAFLVAAHQLVPLVGSHGLMPAKTFLARVDAALGSRWQGFARYPTLFWLGVSDRALVSTAWLGVGLSTVVVVGFANSILMLILWALYLSIVHVGQLWYGYGWEIQLLETGFLAIFLCPLFDPRPFPRTPPPAIVISLHRWLIFRIMIGAGLIKLRGDRCWRELTCLYYHYETQPLPNPLSPYFHFLPRWAHRGGALFNHATELIAPWFAFGPGVVRHVAGAAMLAFQVTLVLSGNLSFLNYLTIVPILACFDDRLLARVLPRRLAARADRARVESRPSRAQTAASWALAALIAFLSIGPVANMLSPGQVMNSSFDPLELVNTYGAFGSVGRERHEIVFEGTRDETIGPETRWKAYEFPCKPGDPMRRPCVCSPYQYRLDWQIWFAAMSTAADYPWTLHFVWKLLHGDRGVIGLLANDPFPERPPRWVRARLFRYEFAPRGERGTWWHRKEEGEWLPPLAADDPRLRNLIRSYDWD